MRNILFVLMFVSLSSTAFGDYIENLIQKAKDGDLSIQVELGSIYYKKEILEEFKKKAEGGDEAAKEMLRALCRVYASHVEHCIENLSDDCRPLLLTIRRYRRQEGEKIQELRNKAESGDVSAQLFLGALIKGNEGLNWLTKAAENGSIDAQLELGNMFYEDNPDEGFKWYLKAAEQGDVTAQKKVASTYSTGYTNFKAGKTIPRDDDKSFAWYLKAAEKGDADAQFAVACVYFRKGTPMDVKEAHKWCLKAAEQGNSPAMGQVAEMFLDGVGTDMDYEKAYFWYSMYEVEKMQELLRTQLSVQQIERIDKMVQEKRKEIRRMRETTNR